MMMRQQVLPLQPSENRNFSNFFISQKNAAMVEYLKNFSLSQAEKNAEKMIYLSGESGCGLTHLLKACVNQKANHIHKKNLYFDLNNINNINNINNLNNINIIALDNIHTIAENRLAEETVFNLFNQIYAQNQTQHTNKNQPAFCYLLAASCFNPAQINFNLPDLKSRLQSLLLLTISTLSDAEKISALQMRARLRGFELPQEAGEYLLKHFQRDTGFLFSSLDKLDKLSLEEKRKLTIPFVKKIL